MHAAASFAARLSTLGLSPPDAGILRVLSQSEGLSQQQLATALAAHASRLVALVDALEGKGLVERRDDPADRRSYALHLTAKGKSMLERVARVGREHNEALCASLTRDEHEQLATLLGRMAQQQGLTAGVHPGFSRARPRK
jgi:DNA-binding MarR family transcriptional regulator